MENETVYFCMLIIGDGGLMGGLVHQEDFENWDEGKKKLVIQQPQKLALIPIHRQNEIVGFNAMFGPVYPMHTEQKTMLVDPIGVEILGTVSGENELTLEGIIQVKDLFESYKSSRQNWRIQLSGLEIPTAAESKNILDFPGNK